MPADLFFLDLIRGEGGRMYMNPSLGKAELQVYMRSGV